MLPLSFEVGALQLLSRRVRCRCHTAGLGWSHARCMQSYFDSSCTVTNASMHALQLLSRRVRCRCHTAGLGWSHARCMQSYFDSSCTVANASTHARSCCIVPSLKYESLSFEVSALQLLSRRVRSRCHAAGLGLFYASCMQSCTDNSSMFANASTNARSCRFVPSLQLESSPSSCC